MKIEAKELQYTIRRVPRSVDRALRQQAKRRHMSMNAVLLDVVTKAAGVSAPATVRHDLDSFVGSWVKDPATDRALANQRTVERGDWE